MRLLGSLLWCSLCQPAIAGEVVLRNPAMTVTVDPSTLGLRVTPTGKTEITVSAPSPKTGQVSNLQQSESRASWRLNDPGLAITLDLEADGLQVRFVSDGVGELSWPIFSPGAAARAWMLPLFEGVYVPAEDARWLSFLTQSEALNTTADFILPFWGLDYGDFTLTCLLLNPFNNQAKFESAAGRMRLRLTHQFTRNHPVKQFGVRIWVGAPSPIEPARQYRRWLETRGEFVSLRDKIRRTPGAEKLLGAAHVYLWGDGISPQMIQELAEAGFDRLWLGAEGWAGFVERPDTVTNASARGYLIGPYDSYHSIHAPDEPDTWPTAQFDAELYRTGAIIRADGTQRRGFKGKGYLLSPKAARPYVERRVSNLMKTFPANSWFVDCDGYGQYFDDYATDHPATQPSDLAERMARCAWIRDAYGAVIGSEACSAGAAGTMHFAHGVLTPVIGWGDPDLTNRQSQYYLGGYYPPHAPAVFFKPVPLKEEYRHRYFDPRFRLPLFQTVFHDSVVATHHWSSPSWKFSNAVETVELLELLYNVPPLYHLNREEFQRRKLQMKAHYDFFSPLHRELGVLPLTGFQWLTADRTVQQTVIGDRVELVANFGEREFQRDDLKVPARSVVARWRETGKRFVFTAWNGDGRWSHQPGHSTSIR